MAPEQLQAVWEWLGMHAPASGFVVVMVLAGVAMLGGAIVRAEIARQRRRQRRGARRIIARLDAAMADTERRIWREHDGG
ncbi:MAG: hypothetical protein ACOC7J_06195 [Armatimonadota bacterium]